MTTLSKEIPSTAPIEAPRSEKILRKSLTNITLEGTFATVFIILTGGAFLTGLALFLGATDFEIGLLAAIPFLAQTAQLLAAYIIGVTRKRKLVTVRSLGISRQIWWLLLPLPLLQGDWRLNALIAIFALSNIAAMMGAAGWLSWVADLIPDRIRGRYFGFRNAAIASSSIATTLVGGAILDHFRANHQDGYGFSIIIGISCLLGLGTVILLSKLPDKPIDSKDTKITWAHILEPLRNKSFSHLIKISFAWNFAVGISAAFFAAHMLTNLKMTFFEVALYSSAGSLIAVLLNKPWGIIVDRFGSKPVIVFCAFGLSLVPMLWWIPRPGHLEILVFEAIYSSALWTGFVLGTFNIPIVNSPRESRTMYLAVYSVISGLGFFMASIIGGALAESWKWIHFQLGFQTILNYHILFAISGLMRFLGAFLALGFHAPSEKDVPTMIRYIRESIFRYIPAGGRIFRFWT